MFGINRRANLARSVILLHRLFLNMFFIFGYGCLNGKGVLVKFKLLLHTLYERVDHLKSIKCSQRNAK